MKKIVLLKYGELVLKGLNRSYFDNLLLRRVRTLLRGMAAPMRPTTRSPRSASAAVRARIWMRSPRG